MAEEQAPKQEGQDAQAETPANTPAPAPVEAANVPAETAPAAEAEAPVDAPAEASSEAKAGVEAAPVAPSEAQAEVKEEKKPAKPKKPKAPTTPPAVPYTEEITKDIKKNRFMGAIAYIPLIGWIVVLALGAGSRYASFHARQALIFCLLQMLAGASMMVGSIGFLVLGMTLGLGFVGFLEGASGHYWNLPIVGAIAQKLTFL